MLFAVCAPWAHESRHPGRLTRTSRSGYLPLGFPPRLNSAAPPWHKSPSHLEDRQMDTALILRIFHHGRISQLSDGRALGSPDPSSASNTGDPLVATFPVVCGRAKESCCSPLIPALILPLLLRSVRTVSAPSPGGHAWQAWLPRTLASISGARRRGRWQWDAGFLL